MKQDERLITFVPLGEQRTLFVPLDCDNKQYYTALGFFVKKEGKFEGTIFTEDLVEHLDEVTPVVAFRFKNKKSINDLIKFLKFYRDEIYKKQYKEVNDETR